MPPGTWSDDSSMALATLDSIREKGEANYSDIMERFYKWTFFGEYTPAGKAFDQGSTCVEAICNYVYYLQKVMHSPKMSELTDGRDYLVSAVF